MVSLHRDCKALHDGRHETSIPELNDTAPKPASSHTIGANQEFRNGLDFADTSDFDDANKGFIATDDILTIYSNDKDENGNRRVVWDMEEYKSFISSDKDAPDTVNPSLWRNAQLCMLNGLFQVTENIFQVRGYDLSNITFVKGNTGWIVFDPLISAECSAAALKLVNDNIKFDEDNCGGVDAGPRKVVAVIYSHSHVDHFGGAHGVINEEDAISGKVKVLASEGFTEHAVSENVIAGNAMGRRSIYMYGSLLPRNEKGSVNSGLGQTISTGSKGLIIPNDFIHSTGETRTIDGVEMVFQFTPGSEAPTEMNTFFPDWEALWMAENTTCTMHNILTLRGAVVRDALKWAEYLTETIDLWGKKSKVKFQSHHWPLWGSEKIFDYLKKQRDTYKFIHDQSVRLMNQGYIGSEISEMLKLPEELHTNWPTRGYYGTLRHNSRAVYQRYMGWYSGNPSDLNNLPPVDAAKKYVEYMEGEEKILKKAKQDYRKGEYRWVAEALKHVVFANADNREAKLLLADAYEQMGYQAESGAWRSAYLQGASELRNNVPDSGGEQTASPQTIKNMEPGMLFDYLGVRLDQQKAEGKKFTLKIIFTDLSETYTLNIENSVLSYTGNPTEAADVNLTLSKQVLIQILTGSVDLTEAVQENLISVSGDRRLLLVFLGLFDNFEFWFNIVTP